MTTAALLLRYAAAPPHASRRPLRRLAKRLLTLDPRGRRDAALGLIVVARPDALRRLVTRLLGLAAPGRWRAA